MNQPDINSQYQKYLGRDATPSELSSMMAYGNTGAVNLNPEDIGRIIQSMPEFQNKQLANYGQQYSDQLGQSDQRMLGIAQNDLTGQFAQMGRNPTGSGYVNAFANAAANLASQRQNTLAQFYGQGYQNIMGNSQNQGNQAYGFGKDQQVSGLQRQWDLQDYAREQNDYQNWVNSQNRKGFGAGFGSVLGQTGTALGGAYGMYQAFKPSPMSSGGGGGGYGAGQYNQGFGGYQGFQGTNSSMANATRIASLF